MDWDRYKYFYVVASEGNVSKAAKKTGIAQSSLTRSILSLEKSLNVTLFIRSPRGMTLTEDGKILLQHVCKMLSEVEDIQSSLDNRKTEIKGELKLTTGFGFASTSLFQHLAKFIEENPKIILNLFCNDQNLDLRVREADVSIRTYDNDGDSLTQEYLATRVQHLYASPEYLKRNGIPEVLSDLKNHDIIVFGGSLAYLPYSETNWLSTLCLSSHGFKIEPSMTVNSVECLYQAACAGLGIISLSSDSILLQNKTLTPVLPDIYSPEVKLYYVYPSALSTLKTVRSLGDFLKKAYSAIDS